MLGRGWSCREIADQDPGKPSLTTVGHEVKERPYEVSIRAGAASRDDQVNSFIRRVEGLNCVDK
jgi:hypothetical protein